MLDIQWLETQTDSSDQDIQQKFCQSVKFDLNSPSIGITDNKKSKFKFVKGILCLHVCLCLSTCLQRYHKTKWKALCQFQSHFSAYVLAQKANSTHRLVHQLSVDGDTESHMKDTSFEKGGLLSLKDTSIIIKYFLMHFIKNMTIMGFYELFQRM